MALTVLCCGCGSAGSGSAATISRPASSSAPAPTTQATRASSQTAGNRTGQPAASGDACALLTTERARRVLSQPANQRQSEGCRYEGNENPAANLNLGVFVSGAQSGIAARTMSSWPHEPGRPGAGNTYEAISGLADRAACKHVQSGMHDQITVIAVRGSGGFVLQYEGDNAVPCSTLVTMAREINAQLR